MSTEKVSGQTIEFRKNDLLPLLFGAHNAHLHYLEDRLGIDIADRGNRLTLSGDAGAIKTAEHILNRLWNKIEQNHEVGTAEIDAELRFLEDKEKPKTQEQKDKVMSKDDIVIKTKKKTIVARSPNQALYMRSILDHEMVFGLGPAGTGKTYLAVAVGVAMYLEGKVERLIFARPAVEAGERLGFLPGDMKDKVDPYLRPIYDALHDMMPYDFMVKKIEDGDIEIAPLAFMRGRTLSNAFVILDEAQNTTTTQMKMILTRLGESSRMVINGDLSQTDLPVGVKSGLRDASEILDGIEDIQFIHFQKDDVIRHKLVSKIVNAYENKK
ncbi:MAG TPA: PhoH family protein [Alphaproteobacteria bacterium]|nr:PhoH family protein [Alphaproteobacteria bacterium]